ncbi:MAG: ABC transporter ATP-binding protein [Niameybacter sp.]|uniref:ABC transporter ATP-binding protein n=1 Tax=Niameybacter sp. TaxID=2033640 RepID=UPI002FCA4672
MKTQDSGLIKRLLAYAKPYKGWFVIVLLLMVISTVADLAKPVLIGNAVDLFTEGYKTPYVVTTDTKSTVEYEGQVLRHLKPDEQVENVYQMIQYKNVYYWIEDMALTDSTLLENMIPEAYSQAISIEPEGVSLTVNGNTYKGSILEQEDLKVLRSLNLPALAYLAMLFLVVLAVSFGFLYLQAIILQYIGQKIILAVRHEIYEKMLYLPDRFYHQNPIGKLVTRVTNDTETLNEMYTSVLVNLLKQVLFLMGVMVMMVATDVKTALWVFALIPLVIAATFIYKYFSRIAYRDVRNRLTQMNTFLSEHLSGMRIIQIFTREEAKVKQMKGINAKLYKAGMREMTAFMLFRPFIFVLSSVGVGLVLLVGGNSVLKGAMSVGALIIMVSYTKDFFGPIEQLAENFSVLQSALASAEKIFSILDEENEIQDGTFEAKEGFSGSIEFKNVWFAYEEEDWILRDVSFKIEAGQKVAFVGATGAGKTSILSLICRYYDIQKGQILIDGKDIKDYEIASLRSQVGQVLQDVFMFTGDVKSNIRLGSSSISQETIEKASKLVNAHEFIEKLQDQYDEKVLERGASLSTGQRQLISFARAVAYDPKIFILDEATANIDTETESLIQDALYKMMEGRTTLMVAHRLSTIQHADNIIVLHKGKIREMGNHQTLLGNKGIYYNLYQLALQSQVMS